MTRPLHNLKTSFTPANVQWVPWQLAVHAGPALDKHIRLMNRYRNKIEAMLEEKSWNSTQHTEGLAILDHLARLGIIYNGAEDGHIRAEMEDGENE